MRDGIQSLFRSFKHKHHSEKEFTLNEEAWRGIKNFHELIRGI